MMVETVKIVADVTPENPLGYIVINKSDLLPEHRLFDAPPEPTPEAEPEVDAAPTEAPAPSSRKASSAN